MNANSFWLLTQQQQERDVIPHPRGPSQMRDLNTTLKTTASWSFRKLCTGRSPQLSRASAHGCRPCAVTPLATAKHMDTFVLIAQKKKQNNKNIWKKSQQSYSQSVTAHAIMNKGSCKVTFLWGKIETGHNNPTPQGWNKAPYLCCRRSVIHAGRQMHAASKVTRYKSPNGAIPSWQRNTTITNATLLGILTQQQIIFKLPWIACYAQCLEELQSNLWQAAAEQIGLFYFCSNLGKL